MNIQHINATLAQILLTANGLEEYRDREINMIHFIKYLYLVDLFYCEEKNGEIFTSIPWRFHNYGPWDASINDYIDEDIASLGAVKTTVNPAEGDEFYRWGLNDRYAAEKFSSDLDVGVKHFVIGQVNRFANRTPELLDFVYKTPPMLHAAPGEFLVFQPTGFSFKKESLVFDRKPSQKLTPRQEKKLKEWRIKGRKLMAEKFDQTFKKREQHQPTICFPQPRFDDVYFNAMRQMDAIDFQMFPPGEYTVHFDDSVWKSEARSRDDIS